VINCFVMHFDFDASCRFYVLTLLKVQTIFIDRVNSDGVVMGVFRDDGCKPRNKCYTNL